MGTDFFDQDLRSDSRIPARAPIETDEPESADTISAHAISRLVVQKHERTTQVAGAVQEMELLRSRQRELEREKENLEALARKQEGYERDKREVVEKLERSLVEFEKQAAEAMRAADLISAVRLRFEESLDEVKQIDEDHWVKDQFESELNKAMVVIDQAQAQYKKGLSKVSTAGWFRAGESASLPALGGAPVPSAFGFWLKAGLAFSLPLMVVAAICFALWLLRTGVVP